MTISEAFNLADRLFLLSGRIYRAATASRDGNVDLFELQIRESFSDALKKCGLTDDEVKRLVEPADGT